MIFVCTEGQRSERCCCTKNDLSTGCGAFIGFVSPVSLRGMASVCCLVYLAKALKVLYFILLCIFLCASNVLTLLM